MKFLILTGSILLSSLSFGQDTCAGKWAISKNVQCRHAENGVERIENYADSSCPFEVETVTAPNATVCGTQVVSTCVAEGTRRIKDKCLIYDDGNGPCIQWTYKEETYCTRYEDTTIASTCTHDVTSTTVRTKCKSRDIYNSDFHRECSGSIATFTESRDTERPAEERFTEKQYRVQTAVDRSTRHRNFMYHLWRLLVALKTK